MWLSTKVQFNSNQFGKELKPSVFCRSLGRRRGSTNYKWITEFIGAWYGRLAIEFQVNTLIPQTFVQTRGLNRWRIKTLLYLHLLSLHLHFSAISLESNECEIISNDRHKITVTWIWFLLFNVNLIQGIPLSVHSLLIEKKQLPDISTK